MRVHDLAKEYGMQSKELLEHLADMKIPAKSASSTLEDAYISIVRKKLQPIMEARAAEIAAQKAAEEEAAAKEAKAAAEAAEAERLAAEARREAERAEEEKKRAKEEAARKKEEERRRAEEEKKRREAEEAERNRIKDTAPKAAPSFNNLLDQIAQQEEVLKQQSPLLKRRPRRDQETTLALMQARQVALLLVITSRMNAMTLPYLTSVQTVSARRIVAVEMTEKTVIAAWHVRQRLTTEVAF